MHDPGGAPVVPSPRERLLRDVSGGFEAAELPDALRLEEHVPHRIAPGDTVSAAVAAGRRAGRGEARPEPHVLRQAGEIATLARGGGDANATHAILLGLASAYPTCERLQVLAARVADACQSDGALARTWEGVHRRFPTSVEPFRQMLRWTMRSLGRDAALHRLRQRFPVRPNSASDLKLYAWGQEELRNIVEADAAFEAVLALSARREASYLQFSQALLKRGEIWRACRVLSKGRACIGNTVALGRALEGATAERDELESVASPSIRDGRASDAVLHHIFGRLAETRLRARRAPRSLGPIAMVTGTLGAGGAERQLTLTAAALQSAVLPQGVSLAGYRLAGPVEVFCRSLRDRPGGDFFAGTLRGAGVAVHEYARLAPFGAFGRASVTSEFQPALRFLPGPMAEGVIHLADALRARSPHVVHIWQDGSIFASGLAAVMAGVPRIVLSVRSLPPIDRPERYKPEYDLVFRSLLALPGVSLTANSKAAALRYAEWLCIDPDRVAIVYNGVDPLPTASTADDREAAARFDAATADADFTVGSVMRLDENKRPLLWLEAAARLHARAARTRFIIVGDGPLRDVCASYAQTLGIAHRVLFVGRSHRVGFWLERMDTFMLLSLIEGMPNVLIEAQHAGLPIVATDAGGTAEAIRQDVSGILLPTTMREPQAIAAELIGLRADAGRRASMGQAGRAWAKNTFSVKTMVERTVQVFMA